MTWQGSFGEVVEALDMQTGEKVAIKIVKRHPDYTLQAQGEIATFELLHQNYQDRDHPGQRNIGTDAPRGLMMEH